MKPRDRLALGGLLVALVLVTAGILGYGRPTTVVSVATPQPSLVLRTYREGSLGRPVSPNPLAARSQADRDLVALAYSGLLGLGPGGTLVPDLAERWSVDPTGRTYTVDLRPDAVWHDGVPVTADDVVFTIETLRDPEYRGPGAGSWADVRVAAAGERRVVFRLATPLGGFPHALTQPIAPAHLFAGLSLDELGGDGANRRPIGSGPFRIVEWDSTRALLAPAPETSLADPSTPTASARGVRRNLDRIELRYAGSPAALAEAYRRGELDAAVGLPARDARALAAATGSRYLGYPSTTLTAVVLDLRRAHREFRDVRVRRALLAAIDRDGLVETVLDGAGVVAETPIPPGSWAFDPAANPALAFDPAAAAKALEAAGWRRLDGGWAAPGARSAYRVELVAPSVEANPTAHATAERVAEAWRRLGLTVDLAALDPLAYAERLRSARFAAAVVDVEIGLDPDLYPLLASTQARTGGANLAGLQDPELDRLLTAARAPGDDARRKAAYSAVQGYLARQRYLLGLYFRDEPIVVSPRVVGPAPRLVEDPGDRFWDVLTWRLADDR